ncbi:MAG TPA: hypothetical protein VKU86_14760, partial [Acidimicrobiales bacterium]|nr:hypothetical protein [Acidimicrobiales bacterium]
TPVDRPLAITIGTSMTGGARTAVASVAQSPADVKGPTSRPTVRGVDRRATFVGTLFDVFSGRVGPHGVPHAAPRLVAKNIEIT